MAIGDMARIDCFCQRCGKVPTSIEFVEMIESHKPKYTIWSPYRCGDCGSDKLINKTEYLKKK